MSVNMKFATEVITLHKMNKTSLENYDEELELLEVRPSNEVLSLLALAAIGFVIGAIAYGIYKLLSSKKNNTDTVLNSVNRNQTIIENNKREDDLKNQLEEYKRIKRSDDRRELSREQDRLVAECSNYSVNVKNKLENNSTFIDLYWTGVKNSYNEALLSNDINHVIATRKACLSMLNSVYNMMKNKQRTDNDTKKALEEEMEKAKKEAEQKEKEEASKQRISKVSAIEKALSKEEWGKIIGYKNAFDIRSLEAAFAMFQEQHANYEEFLNKYVGSIDNINTMLSNIKYADESQGNFYDILKDGCMVVVENLKNLSGALSVYSRKIPMGYELRNTSNPNFDQRMKELLFKAAKNPTNENVEQLKNHVESKIVNGANIPEHSKTLVGFISVEDLDKHRLQYYLKDSYYESIGSISVQIAGDSHNKIVKRLESNKRSLGRLSQTTDKIKNIAGELENKKTNGTDNRTETEKKLFGVITRIMKDGIGRLLNAHLLNYNDQVLSSARRVSEIITNFHK